MSRSTTAATVRLRELRWQDLDVLDPIERALFGRDAWSPASWWSELAARPHTAYRVLERVDGDELVGYAGLARSRPVADVMTIAVSPSMQARGYGRVLLDWLVSAAGQAGAEDLLLEVRADNQSARALYQAAGFRQLSVRRRYYQPDGVDALVLRRRLQPREGDPQTMEPDR